MKKWIYAGAALLIVQLGLALIIHSNTREFEAFTPQANLLTFSPHEVDSMTFFGEAGQAVTLKKENGKWIFPDEKFNAPADNKKIDDLLKKLASLKQGLAVATSKGAAKRFKVSEDDFQRHIILKKGETSVADFYLGTSPGFKKVHARVQGQDDILSVALNTYEFETDYDNWLDRNIAQVEKDKILGISTGEISLAMQDNVWVMADLADEEDVDSSKIDELVSKISDLSVDGIIDPKDHQGLFDKDIPVEIIVTLSDENKRTYAFAKPGEEDHYVLKLSDYDYFFKINNWTVDEIKKLNRNAVVISGDKTPEKIGNGNSLTEGQ